MTGTTRRRAQPRPVEEVSAGGLVLDRLASDARGAVIGKSSARGRPVWTLPKGHVEAGESLSQTAVREVAEETGLAADVVAPLGEVGYWFVLDGRRIHKRVHHFLLLARGGRLASADVEVQALAWVPLAELAGRLSYPSERALLDRLPDLVAGHR